jgi:putative endonuclease
MFYAYVIENAKGILYKGSSNNLEKRLGQHNANNGFPSFTAKRGPWKLIYSEEFKTRKEAEARESFFKTGAGRRFLRDKIKK